MELNHTQTRPPPLVAQDEDDIMKWLSDGSADLSSPDGSPFLVLEDSASTPSPPDTSAWGVDDAMAVPMPDVSIDLPDLGFFQTGFDATEYAQFPHTETTPIQSTPASPIPLVPVLSHPPPPSVSAVPIHTTTHQLITSKKVSRSKKRPRISEPPPVPSPEQAEVALTREKLLQISSQSMELYVENLESTRALTMDDQKELKRQKRLIKNRESAQLSRERKRAYIDQLEDKINQLVNENTLLKNENTTLRQALSQYQTVPTLVVPSADVTVTTHAKPDPYATKMAGLLTSATSIGGNRPTSNTAKAGVCLLIVLFTFGLFMNANTPGPHGGSLVPIVKSPAIPDVIPAYHERSIGYKRSILEVLDEDDDYIDQDPKQVNYSEKQLVPVKSPRPMLQQPIQVKPAGIYKLSYSPEPAQFLESSARSAKIADDGSNSTYMLFLDPRPDLDNDGIPDPPPSDLQVSTTTTTTTATTTHTHSRLPPMIITLVVPNDIANGSNPLFPKDKSGFVTADSLMELTCQVVDVSITTSERAHTHN